MAGAIALTLAIPVAVAPAGHARVDDGTLTDDQIEQLGRTLLLGKRTKELLDHFGLEQTATSTAARCWPLTDRPGRVIMAG